MPSPFSAPKDAQRPSPDRDANRAAQFWHGALFVAAWFSGLGLWAASGSAPGLGRTLIWPLLALVTPSGAGLFLARTPRTSAQILLLAFWVAGASCAVAFSGGLWGPLAVWILLPLAASTAMGSRMAEAAALSVAAGGVLTLIQVSGRLPGAEFDAGPWLTIIGLFVFALAMGSASILALVRFEARRSRLAARAEELDGVLKAQPLLTLELARDGAILRTYGGFIEPLIDGAPPASFMALGEDPAALARTVATAFQTGAADFFFSPDFGDRPWLAASLRRRGAGLIAVLRDDSGEGAREAALAEAAREAIAASQGKSRFLANMSHELRTPLNAIVGFSDIMRAEMFGPLDPKYAEYASLIHESGGHLLELINDVLDMSKIEAERYSLALETFDAREPVAAAVRLMRIQAETANVRLLPALSQEPVRVRADRRALKQIVLNLLSNAIKFTPSGGRVSVMLQIQGDEVEIIVADDGIGISPDDLARLGTPFEQAGDAQQRARGSGLGLSLVRAFAELHGGRMEVASEAGAGTAVEVRLPILVEAEAYRGDQASQALGEEPSPDAFGENVIRFAPERRT